MLGKLRWIYVFACNLGALSDDIAWRMLPHTVSVNSNGGWVCVCMCGGDLRWCICPIGKVMGRFLGELCWLCWPTPLALRLAHSFLEAPPPPSHPSSSCFCHYAPLCKEKQENKAVRSAPNSPWHRAKSFTRAVSEMSSRMFPLLYLWSHVKTSTALMLSVFHHCQGHCARWWKPELGSNWGCS